MSQLKTLFESSFHEFIKFINYLEDAIFVMEVVSGESFRYVALNSKAIELAGFNGCVIGKHISDVMDEDNARLLNQEYMNVCRLKEPRTYEQRSNDDKVGETILTPIMNEKGEVTYVLAVTRDITKRKKAEEKLLQSEQRYQSLVDYHSSAVYTLDADGKVNNANRATSEILGYETLELSKSSFRPIIEPEEIEKVEHFFSKALHGETVQYETKVIHKEGNLIDCSIINIPIFVNGDIVGVYGILNDITKEKRMNQAIKDSEERYSRLINYSPDAVIIHSDGFIEYANEAAVSLFEVNSNEQLIGKSIYDFFPIQSREKVKQSIQLLLEEGNESSLQEEKIKTVNGNEIDVEISRIEINDKGKKAVHSVIRDISKRKKVEKALVESEERYRLITENTRDLIQLVDVNRKTLYASPSHKRMLGFHQKGLIGHTIVEIVHKDFQQQFIDKFEYVLHKKNYESIEVKAKHNNGTWLWLQLDITPIVDENNNIEKILLVGEDITKRKDYEAKIHYMAYYDPLTGLPNRSFFKEKVKKVFRSALRDRHQAAILYLDCDNFKPINDELGHDVGDLFLQSLANRLKSCIRENDTIARIGGDEFNILMPSITHCREVEDVIEKILACAREHWTYEEQDWIVTMSVGVALYPKDGKGFKSIIKKADAALYKAKENGKNTYAWYEAEVQETI
ncbi:PAS domain S-box protein [Evansella sp. AB-rgal1]|uniref:PAS domain S-box protein n=1 Tax=Evansella sp. AB-rgal1 TaxID=3242696 RepID=UPI00359D0E36